MKYEIWSIDGAGNSQKGIIKIFGKWGPALINSTIYLKYLKPKMKTYICLTNNYFATTEGKFKAQYNNHKNAFAHCIDQKAT